ncbi:MAG: hypothetical protein J6U51_03350 [Bacteroidales bacterium]|nr:hypothetical protein [Bacteroidales bacterium]
MKKSFLKLFLAVFALALVLAVCGLVIAYFGGYGAIFAGCVVCGLIAPENRNN